MDEGEIPVMSATAPDDCSGLKTIIVLILLFAAGNAITIGAIVLTVLGGGSGGDSPDGGDGGDGGGSGGKGGGVDGGGSGGGSPPPFVPVATTPPKAPKSVLLCAIGMGGVLDVMIPQDGVCDFLFYTHMMCPNCNEEKRFAPIGDDTAYKELLVKARIYLVTTFGISLDQAAGEGLRRDDLFEACANAWNQNISHFGMLNIQNMNNYREATEGSMQQLKVFNDFLVTKRAVHRGKLHVAVAVGTEDGNVESAPLNLAMAINTFGPFPFLTIVIVRSHVTHWQFSPDDIEAVGPNTMTNASIPSQPTSFVVGSVLKGANIDTSKRYVMMSFTMGSAGFRMPDTWTGGVVDTPMVHTLLAYPQTCVKDMGQEMDAPEDMSKRKENSTLHFLIMYDNHEMFKTKVEHFYANYLESSGSGIAAFDLEYDDFANICGEGSFRRLKAIKDVVKIHS